MFRRKKQAEKIETYFYLCVQYLTYADFCVSTPLEVNERRVSLKIHFIALLRWRASLWRCSSREGGALELAARRASRAKRSVDFGPRCRTKRPTSSPPTSFSSFCSSYSGSSTPASIDFLLSKVRLMSQNSLIQLGHLTVWLSKIYKSLVIFVHAFGCRYVQTFKLTLKNI